jgi:pyruvate carboxylase subunit B
MKYFVKVGTTTHEVVIDGETVSLNGETVRGRVDSLEGTPLQLLTIGSAVHRVLARRAGRGQYDLSIDGYRVEVDALDERSRVIRELSSGSAKKSGPAHVHAPMPGLIVRINVKEGEAVRAGQGLIVMEAMKMENELRAAAAGTIRRVLVGPGSAVVVRLRLRLRRLLLPRPRRTSISTDSAASSLSAADLSTSQIVEATTTSRPGTVSRSSIPRFATVRRTSTVIRMAIICASRTRRRASIQRR